MASKNPLDDALNLRVSRQMAADIFLAAESQGITVAELLRSFIDRGLVKLQGDRQIASGEFDVLSCPFCGSEHVKTSLDSTPAKHLHRWEICCWSCTANIRLEGKRRLEPDSADEQLLISRWNNRV